MTREEIKTYTMQISQANASALLCIAYDLWEHFAEEAQTAYENTQQDAYQHALKKLQRVNQEIISMLNRENACASDVRTIHFFINQKIVACMVKHQPVELDRIQQIVKKLHQSFMEICRKDTDAPLMSNTQQVYAGLTYGRGTLNESMDPMAVSDRGFFA